MNQNTTNENFKTNRKDLDGGALDIHKAIGKLPRPAREWTVYYNLYGDMKQLSSKPKFKIGDKVRISKYNRKVFDKGYTPNWTEEIFLINKIQSTNPITYR